MAKITFNQSQNTVFLTDGSPLTALEDMGVTEIPFGCRSAACGTCLIQVITGGENLSPRTEEEVELLNDFDLNKPNYRLACQCKIIGDICIEAID